MLIPLNQDQRVVVDMVLGEWPEPKTSPSISFDFSGYELDMKVVVESSKGDKNGHRDTLMNLLTKQRGEGRCAVPSSIPLSSCSRTPSSLTRSWSVPTTSHIQSLGLS